MKGLGHAILTGETLIGREPFGVVLADDLCVGDDDGVLTQMARIYAKYRCSVVAIEEVPHDEVHKYGVIAGSELEDGVYVVSKMVEKPEPEEAPSNLAIIGRYILTPDIFDVIRNTPPGRNGEIQITDALQTQAENNMVLAYRFKGQTLRLRQRRRFRRGDQLLLRTMEGRLTSTLDRTLADEPQKGRRLVQALLVFGVTV